MRFFVGSILDYSLEINFPPSRDLATGKPMPDNAATSPAITKACVENEKCGRGRRAEVALRCLSGRFFFFFVLTKAINLGRNYFGQQPCLCWGVQRRASKVMCVYIYSGTYVSIYSACNNNSSKNEQTRFQVIYAYNATHLSA